MATSARGFTLSRLTNPTLSDSLPFPPQHQLHLRLSSRRRFFPGYSTTVSCLSGAGGVYNDDFVSTRKSNLDRGFLVIASLLKRIQPLDTCVISKGVSDAAKDSMKQTISSMLGLLPSDQYTLWNAEYRISLMRNFDISLDGLKRSTFSREGEVLDKECDNRESEGGDISVEDLERMSPQVFGDLSPEALNYVQRLQSELSNVKEVGVCFAFCFLLVYEFDEEWFKILTELNAMKLENTRMEYDKGTRNNLLEYLRSLDPDMVNELSQPSSIEVEEIVHQLVQNILRRSFNDDATSNFMGVSVSANIENHQDADSENYHTVGTSRDYLAKLLFWCMLLGHHLRGLENRLHLTCAVGLL
ncbi:hypothetical protein JRO89_XS01G0245000 [Xanthoceras sorbifolium]|uniref:Uncharacterized protein n=1 Tax=Xanthoceras sorbifolium TaxID=99658 RepID=A0ABQ8IL14_9ROSI|nr:hypothetical protein JRO89_XS01G0245000 [Xanthoceras sorbifolium]